MGRHKATTASSSGENPEVTPPWQDIIASGVRASPSVSGCKQTFKVAQLLSGGWAKPGWCMRDKNDGKASQSVLRGSLRIRQIEKEI